MKTIALFVLLFLVWPIFVTVCVVLLEMIGLIVSMFLSFVIWNACERFVGRSRWKAHKDFIGIVVLAWTCGITIFLPTVFLPKMVTILSIRQWEREAAPLPELGAVVRMKNGEWRVRCKFPSEVDDERVHQWLPKLLELRVQSLDLDGSRITNAAAHDLAAIKSLTHLDLSRTSVGDELLKMISQLPSLEAISLNDTQVTDEGLRSLRNCSNLRMINLRGTRITDEGLKHLTSLPNLKDVDVFLTNVTRNGVSAFERKAPHVRVIQ